MIYVYGEYYVVVIYHTKLKVFLDFHPFFTVHEAEDTRRSHFEARVPWGVEP